MLFCIKQRCAQTLAQGRSARLSRGDDLKSAQAKCAGKKASLRGLAASVNAFKGYECSGHSYFSEDEIFGKIFKSRKARSRLVRDYLLQLRLAVKGYETHP